ncbi:hypothetical protein [Fusibacter sp. 3D3]|uniref:hypothetical protein n=1 Tax=Fusibacter sp. 3D3 TaxID=1048380 RepID=UPI000852D9E4|nr:hypothetical protein [Fusibacter sp. 3D3]GAU75642.1 hypothetical protein F3D3_0233 [Fusibacter sp. 3D3]
MLDLDKMKICLNEKTEILKQILLNQLKALEMYDQSPDDLEILGKYETIERLVKNKLQVDSIFLRHYREVLVQNKVESLQALSKIEQNQFKEVQTLIEQIRILEAHYETQAQMLNGIFLNLKVLQNDQLKIKKSMGAYKNIKK